MSSDIKLQEIAAEALNTFPPLGNDKGAASNYAQRVLTKVLSEQRKSGQDITEDAVQDLRAALDVWINTLDGPPTSPVQFETAGSSEKEPEAPSTERLEAVVSACFHVTTDGSPEHLNHLRNTAMKDVTDYLGTTNATWLERRRFKARAKQMIQGHIEDMQQDPSR